MKALKALRQSKKITQDKLACALGVSRSTISMWETSASEPDSEMINNIANFFNVSIDYLFGRTDDPSPSNSDDDEDIWELRERLRTQPGMRTLFSATKNASKEDFLRAVKIIEALKGDSNDDFD